MERQFFAQLDENNIVINVAVVTKEFLENNPDRYPGVWVETFYDRQDKTYAENGFSYDYNKKDFVPPPPIENDYWPWPKTGV